jgi:hypothetical protein
MGGNWPGGLLSRGQMSEWVFVLDPFTSISLLIDWCLIPTLAVSWYIEYVEQRSKSTIVHKLCTGSYEEHQYQVTYTSHILCL